MSISVELLHRLSQDLDFLKRRGIWEDSKLERSFRERSSTLLREGYREKHEDALQNLNESHGLPLTLEEYTSWLSLLTEGDGDLYRDVYAYRHLKEFHTNGNLYAFEEQLGNITDAVLRTRRDLLIDGFLARLETQLYQASENNQPVEDDQFEKMRGWVEAFNLPALVAVWHPRINILQAYCRKHLEDLDRAVETVPDSSNAPQIWVTFRYRQTKTLAENAAQRLIAAILNELNRLDARLRNPDQAPSADDLARGLEYGLIAYKVSAENAQRRVGVAIGQAERQMIERVLARCTQPAQLHSVRAYLADKRDACLRDLAMRPVKEMLAKFEELNGQVGRIYRALGNYRKHPDQTAEINPLFFRELAEGDPNQLPNRGVRNITEKLRIVARGVEELRAQYVKLLSAHEDAVIGKATWELPQLSNEAQTADSELDMIAGQNVNYEVDLFQKLQVALQEKLTEIMGAVDRLAKALSPSRRKTENPLQLYREAQNALAAIEEAAETFRHLQGFERIIDLKIFKVPDPFIRSEPRVALDRYYQQLVGLEAHKRVVAQLIERTEKWEAWRLALLNAYKEGFRRESDITAWWDYAEALCETLPVPSIQALDDGLYGTTEEWLTSIQDIWDRPSFDAARLRIVLKEIGDRGVAVRIERLFAEAPAPALPSDLENHFVHSIEQQLAIPLDPEQGDILRALKKQLNERLEALHAKCRYLETYLEQSARIVGYLKDAENDAEQQYHMAPHRNKPAIMETIQLFRKWRSVLEGAQPPQQAQ